MHFEVLSGRSLFIIICEKVVIESIFYNLQQGDVWIQSAQSVSEDAGNARQPRIFFLVSFFQLNRQYYIFLAILVS